MKELPKLHQMHPEVEQVTDLHPLRKMLHGEDDAPQIKDWLKEAAVASRHSQGLCQTSTRN